MTTDTRPSVRDDLIEAMAMAMASRQKASKAWLEKHPHAMDEYKRDASACTREAVAFVGEWMDDLANGVVDEDLAHLMADAWREDMSE